MTHDHGHDHGAAADKAKPTTPIDWDEWYAASDQIWSGNPNGALIAEVEGITPGTAVDVGTGEGADAIWLTQQGWQVTAFDVSSVALDRAGRHAADSGVEPTFIHGGLLDPALVGLQFDLVSAQYPAVLHEDGRAIEALLGLVAPGGMFLFVHHVDVGGDHVKEAGFEAAEFVLPHDVRPILIARADQWEVLVDENRPRHVTTGGGAGHTEDVILKARRR